MDSNSVEHRDNAVSNIFFSARETDLVLRQLSEFFDEEGLRGTRTLDCERWKSSGEEKEGRVRERGKVHVGCEEG